MLLENIALFQTIVEKGSLAAAGRELRLSPTTVSERLAALEAHYGVSLLNRTTRSFSLTEEGRTLLEGARPLLDEVRDLDARIRHGADTVSGLIRISTPSDLGRNTVSDAIAEFLNAHPQAMIEQSLTDGYVDIVSEGVDLALRFGTVADSSLRVRRLGDVGRVVCAAPDYIKAHGAPATPADLQDHNCLLMRFGRELDNIWHFESGTKKQQVAVRGNRVADDGALVRQWAVNGEGIALKSELDVADDLQSGRLIALLTDAAPPPAALQIMFPPGRALPRRVRTFADFLAAKIKAQIAARGS
ncbi:LysR family transcriptional regulator [Cognatishimia sp. SS12]|uniref:LysR family transcriptional regulator n=1 Tax=Cognatishimia sp. SS12 TaxID=2979465 RepID=UPI00232AB565|nr:LysR family transcriptional regulator [Cognatishimia sp. SS12]MDC0738838.1 LysR family transcriptional regulator [Cognatishimia sp. SS12]